LWVIQRAREFDSQSGTPIPTVFDRLKNVSAEFRYGQLHLIAAAPGIGKSILALIAAIESGVETMYFSMDSDAATQYSRAASIVTGDQHSTVQEAVARGQVGKYDIALNKARNIRFVFDSNPTTDEVNEHLLAYGYAYGMWPRLIIVDNVADIFAETEGHEGLNQTMEWLAALAKKTGACIIGLHHVTGEYEAGDIVVPLSGLRGKISKKPVLILTLNRIPNNDTHLNVAVVKNRGGIASARGTHGCWLSMDLSRMWVETRIARAA
jgi:predicted ATP-dependent serine protease